MMSPPADVTNVECVRALAETFGPVAEVRALPEVGAVQVELDETAPVHTMLVLDALMSHTHTRAGVYNKHDEYVRLHLRGRIDDVGPVIVTLPFHRTRRGKQARMAWDRVTKDDPLTLLERLSALD